MCHRLLFGIVICFNLFCYLLLGIGILVKDGNIIMATVIMVLAATGLLGLLSCFCFSTLALLRGKVTKAELMDKLANAPFKLALTAEGSHKGRGRRGATIRVTSAVETADFPFESWKATWAEPTFQPDAFAPLDYICDEEFEHRTNGSTFAWLTLESKVDCLADGTQEKFERVKSELMTKAKDVTTNFRTTFDVEGLREPILVQLKEDTGICRANYCCFVCALLCGCGCIYHYDVLRPRLFPSHYVLSKTISIPLHPLIYCLVPAYFSLIAILWMMATLVLYANPGLPNKTFPAPPAPSAPEESHFETPPSSAQPPGLRANEQGVVQRRIGGQGEDNLRYLFDVKIEGSPEVKADNLAKPHESAPVN